MSSRPPSSDDGGCTIVLIGFLTVAYLINEVKIKPIVNVDYAYDSAWNKPATTKGYLTNKEWIDFNKRQLRGEEP